MKKIVGREIPEYRDKMGGMYNPLDSIVRNLHDMNSRYLMLISQGDFGAYIVDEYLR